MAVSAVAGATLSGIDSERFGIPIARATDVGPGEIQGILDWCRRAGIAMLIARCPAGALGTVHEFEDAGLRLMDAQVSYGGLARTGARDARLRPLEPDDVQGVRAIAARSFTGYAGHYHADRRLPITTCNLVYPSWATRCCSGEAADHVVVAEVDGRVAGFSAFAKVGTDEGRLVLGAVLPEARGQRLYGAMADYGLDWCQRQGLRRMSAVTQTTNFAAQLSWIRAGMLPQDAWYTFHGWLD